jgi:hypothetical protein
MDQNVLIRLKNSGYGNGAFRGLTPNHRYSGGSRLVPGGVTSRLCFISVSGMYCPHDANNDNNDERNDECSLGNIHGKRSCLDSRRSLDNLTFHAMRE